MATKRYTQPDTCPCCGGHDTRWGRGDREDPRESWVRVTCNSCGAEFVDVFAYDHSEYYGDGPLDVEEDADKFAV